MTTDELDELLGRMPAIAKAVNAFSSDAVQQQAFNSLISAFGGIAKSAASSGATAETGSGPTQGTKPARKTPTSKATSVDGGAKVTRKRSPVKNPAMVNDLNLRPTGKQSLKDFVAAKRPSGQKEQNLVVLYYLKHELGLSKINVDHLFTAYREMKQDWKLPGDLRNSLAQTRTVTGWIETSDMDDLGITAAGTNHVEHDMPKQVKT